MKRNLTALIGLTLLAQPLWAEAPRVVVDIAPVHSLVSAVMEGAGTPDLLIEPGASPHHYALRPSQARNLQNAEVVFWMGGALTPWLEETLETLSGGAKQIELLHEAGTQLLPFRETAVFAVIEPEEEAEEEHHDDHADHEGHDDHADHNDHSGHEEGHDKHAHEEHEHGEDAHDDHAHKDHEGDGHEAHDDHEAHNDHDDHDGHNHEGSDDPHAWLDPGNAAAWLEIIAHTLSEHDPENAALYAENAKAEADRIAQLDQQLKQQLSNASDEGFLTFHDAFQYFTAHYNLNVHGTVRLGDGSDPSPQRIAELKVVISELGAKCVFKEPQYNPGNLTALVEGTSLKVATLDPLGSAIEPGKDLYRETLTVMGDAIHGCLIAD